MAIAAAEPQHLTALRRANESRLAGAALKREVRCGLALEEAIDDPRAASVPICDLIASQHRWGPGRTASLLVSLHIRDTNRRVRELTDRQRRAIVEACVR